MIKGVTANGKYMQITGGSPLTCYFSPGAQGAGQMRYNTNSNVMEVWDGVAWKELSSGYTSVGLSSEAESLLDWARKKRDEEQYLETMSEKYPIIKDLKQQLDMAVALVQS
jgi:hypothetical protein